MNWNIHRNQHLSNDTCLSLCRMEQFRLLYFCRRLLECFDDVDFKVRFLRSNFIDNGMCFTISLDRIGSFSLSAFDERELTVEVFDWSFERIVGRHKRKLALFDCVIVVNEDEFGESKCVREEVNTVRVERDLNIIP